MTASSASAPTIAARRSPRDLALTYVVLTALLIVVVAWNGHKAREMVSLLDFATFLTVAFQPSRWATLLLGSLHSWSLLLLWTALVIDATAAAPASASRGGITSAGRATDLQGAR